MTAQSAVAAGRAAAARRMLDTCTVTRPGAPVTDASTGAVTTAATQVYAGACRVQTGLARLGDPVVGGHSFTIQRYEVHVPVGSFAPAVGDVFTVTDAADDPYLVGRPLRVVALLHKSQATAYRLAVTDEAA